MTKQKRREFLKGTAWMGLAAMAAGLCGCRSMETADDTIVLEGRAGRVTVDVQGGRILSWKTPAGEELLFMPRRTVSPDGDWSHGGISICWPWFGKKGTAASSIHGFARNRRFTVKEHRVAADGPSVTLAYSQAAGAEPDFPYAADLELTVKAGVRLELALRTTNTGKEPFELTNGFQPYFAVSGYKNVTLRGVKKESFAAVDGMDAAFPRLADRFALVDAGDTERFIGLGPSNRAKEGPIMLAPGASHKLVFAMKIVRNT